MVSGSRPTPFRAAAGRLAAVVTPRTRPPTRLHAWPPRPRAALGRTRPIGSIDAWPRRGPRGGGRVPPGCAARFARGHSLRVLAVRPGCAAARRVTLSGPIPPGCAVRFTGHRSWSRLGAVPTIASRPTLPAAGGALDASSRVDEAAWYHGGQAPCRRPAARGAAGAADRARPVRGCGRPSPGLRCGPWLTQLEARRPDHGITAAC